MLLVATTLSGAPAGAVRGTVHDPDGAVATRAAVEIACASSGLRRSAGLHADGVFEFLNVAPGSCAISVEAPGFKRVSVPDVTVTVDRVTRLEIRLEVGERTDTIQVVSGAGLPEIDSPATTTVIHSRAIAEMPLNGRQYLDLAVLAAGAVPAAPGTQGSGFSVGGIRSQSNVYLLDGISNVDTQTNQPLNLFRIAEAVQEFAVQTSLSTPEFGRGSGAQVNVVTKPGGNDFHGAAFEYLRNTVLNASDFFTNKLGSTKSALNRNQFGAAAGGALRRDHTFFFVSYEGFRQIAPTVASTLVPTVQQRTSVTDAVSRSLLGFFPLPNVDGPLNYVSNVRSLDSDDTALARVDRRFGARDQFAARWIQYWGSSSVPGPTPLTGGNRGPVSQVSVMLTEQHIFSPSMLNEFRVGESRFKQQRRVQDDGFDAGAVFTAGDGSALPGVPRNAGLPAIAIGGGFAALGSNANFPQSRTNNTIEIFDNVSRIAPFGAGRHTWRWGGHIRREDLAQSLNRSVRGAINFANFADFARGQINTATLRTGSTQAYWRRYPWDLYWQDEFRVRPNLTLTYGLRYEAPSVLVERRGHATGFVPGYGPMIAGTDRLLDVDTAARGPAALVLRPAGFELPAGGAYPDRNNVAPMFGFGWSPFRDGLTAIRGGARVAYDDLFNNVIANMALAAPYNLQTTQTANVTQPAKFAWPLAFNQNVPLVSNVGQQGPGTPTVGVLSFQAVDPRMRSARAYVYGLTIERRVGATFVEAAYHGSLGRRLGMFVDINQPTVIVRDASRRGPVAPNEQVFPYNHFGQVQLAKSIGNSHYNGMVLSARRPLRRGLLFQASYTLGKSLDPNSSYFGSGNLPGEPGAPIDSRNLRLEHGPSAFDVRHRFVAFFSADVPVPWRSARAVLGGWRVSGIATLQTGTPFTVVTGGPDTSGFNQSTAGTSPDGGNRPNLVKPGPVPQNNRNPDGAFDPSWFTANLAGQDGTSGRNAYYGPGLQNFNVALAKSLPLLRRREQTRASVRADFFNLLNHTNFANPIADLSNAAFGRITQTQGSAAGTSAGTSSGPTGGPRIVQVSLRLDF
jgi:hypothetical protein